MDGMLAPYVGKVRVPPNRVKGMMKGSKGARDNAAGQREIDKANRSKGAKIDGGAMGYDRDYEPPAIQFK